MKYIKEYFSTAITLNLNTLIIIHQTTTAINFLIGERPHIYYNFARHRITIGEKEKNHIPGIGSSKYRQFLSINLPESCINHGNIIQVSETSSNTLFINLFKLWQ